VEATPPSGSDRESKGLAFQLNFAVKNSVRRVSGSARRVLKVVWVGIETPLKFRK
jgi:hypothetical protein